MECILFTPSFSELFSGDLFLVVFFPFSNGMRGRESSITEEATKDGRKVLHLDGSNINQIAWG